MSESQFYYSWNVKDPSPGKSKGIMFENAKWKNHEISISFLDGNEEIKKIVEEKAKMWTKQANGPANLSFSFRKNTNNTLIRISFEGKGNWSTVGTTCRFNNDNSRPTMNLGGLSSKVSNEYIQGVVLHEFGHVLGLLHEHQSPASPIKWNSKRIFEDLSGPPNNLTYDEIYENVIKIFETEPKNHTDFDKDSIMIYPIPKIWLLEGNSINANYQLSKMDIEFIRKQYP